MTVERDAIAGLKWSGLSKFASQLITWGITLAVLRILAPQDYGLMAILSVFISLLASVADLGLGASLVQAKDLSEREIEGVTGIVIAMNLAAFLLLLLAAPLISWFYSEPRLTLLLQVAAIQLIFNGLATVPQALIIREMQFRRLAVIDLVVAIAGGGVTIGMALAGHGVWALLCGSLAQAVARAILFGAGNLHRPSFTRSGMRIHVAFGSSVTLLKIATEIVSQSDILIAGRVLGPQALGLYSVSLHFATLPIQKIMGTVNRVAFPAVAKLQLEPVRLRQRMLEATRLMLLLVVPILWGMSVTAPELVAIIMGRNWAGAIRPMQIVCLAVPLQMINLFYSTAVLGMRDLRAAFFNLCASAVVLPVAFLVGTNWGVNGLACAWLFAVPAVFLLRLSGTTRAVGVSPADLLRTLWAPFVAAGVMYAAVMLVRPHLLDLSIAMRLPLLAIVGICVYTAVIMLLDKKAIPEAMRFVTALRA